MSNIYLKVTIKTFSKLQFSGFKKIVTRPILGLLQLTQISLNFKTSCCNLLSQRVHACCWTKILTLIKTKRKRKWKIPHDFRQTNLVLQFSPYKNPKLKVKLELAKQKRAFLVPFILSEGSFIFIFYKIYILSQCMYWIHFQNIHTFTYQKIASYTFVAHF